MHVAGILATKGTDVATIPPDAPLCDAIELLRDRGVGALVVSADGRRIEGIISERDVVRRLADRGAETLDQTVGALMTTEVRTCRAEDQVDTLMAMLTEHRIRHLPVVDGDGALAGIISIGDVVKHRVQELEQEQQQLIEYVRTGR